MSEAPAEGAATAFVTRFAPSPTGRLHRGHAFSALAAWTAARAVGGRFLLRIEDIDAVRCLAVFEEALFTDLTWLGLDWEQPPRRQSEHLSDYRAALERLRARGLLYRCFRTRAEVMAEIGRAPHGPAPRAGGPEAPDAQARHLAEGRPFAWRLSMAAAIEALGADSVAFFEEGGGPEGQRGLVTIELTRLGDVVLARKDLGVAYHLAVVVDDALQGVTHVIRGVDLFEATFVHRILQALLDLPTPRYRHHPLLLGPDGRRLAKRDSAQTLAELRGAGVSAKTLRAELGFG